MNKLIRILSSLKIAIVVIIVITVLAIIATVIPQDRDPSFYTENYGAALGRAITTVHFHHFWRSALFLVPLGIFFLNLLACSLRRLIGRLSRSAPLRLGPDLIHLSLLLLIIAGVITLFTRHETVVFLAEGSSLEMPDGRLIRLKTFDFEVYEDGRPKDWISRVEIINGDSVEKSFDIEVNKPLRMGRYRIFQSSYRNDVIAVLKKGDESIMMRPGEAMPFDGGFLGFFDYRFSDEDKGVVFILEKDGNRKETILNVGQQLSGVELTDLLVHSETGLQVVTQRGIFIIYLSLIILCIGLFMTFIQKLGDMN